MELNSINRIDWKCLWGSMSMTMSIFVQVHGRAFFEFSNRVSVKLTKHVSIYQSVAKCERTDMISIYVYCKLHCTQAIYSSVSIKTTWLIYKTNEFAMYLQFCRIFTIFDFPLRKFNSVWNKDLQLHPFSFRWNMKLNVNQTASE